MAALTDAKFEAAEARGREMLAAEPRALAAHYDRTTGRVVLDLVNGCSYAFPAQLVQDLQGATDDDLVGVRVEGVGFNLHWPALDADLYVPALVAGVFGTKAWIAGEMARRAGRATSPAKAAAARENGVKGGRPRKSSTTSDSDVQNIQDQSAPLPVASLSGNSRPNDDEPVPIVEEHLVVGKREVDRGGVRVRSYVVETPVNEQASLREENVSIERRPVDRTLKGTGDAFRDRTIEIVETGEEVVVATQAFGKKELTIKKDVGQRTEEVNDTVRHTEVQVESTDGALGPAKHG